jgi:hypothetical protein
MLKRPFPKGALVRWLLPIPVLASMLGCAAVAPLDEPERARIRAIAPVAARFPPSVEFNVPPGKIDGAATGGAAAAGSAAYLCLVMPVYCPAFLAFAPAQIVGFSVLGVAATPSSEGLEAMIGRARGHLGAPDVQQLIVQRFSERVTRLTSYQVVPSASQLGPRSLGDEPSYSGLAAGKGEIVAEVVVESVRATLTEPVEFFGSDYASRPVRVALSGRMRLVRPSDGFTLMSRQYLVARYARRVQEYQDDGTLLMRAVAGAVDEIATLMVDDAFLLPPGAISAGGASWSVSALEPLPRGTCMGIAIDCWGFSRVPRLETPTPRFSWRAFPESAHLEAAPWLRGARNFVYDLWIFGGDDDRFVEGLRSTEYTFERALESCMRYSWAVRARFDTDAGPRASEWSTASAMPRSSFGPDLRPTFGAPFITPCPAATADAR